MSVHTHTSILRCADCGSSLIEETSPGTKHQMYFGFLKKAADRFAQPEDEVEVVPCAECGAEAGRWPTFLSELQARIAKREQEQRKRRLH